MSFGAEVLNSQKSFYEILGVERTASERHHPDAKSEEEIEALELEEADLSQTRIFKMITFAYQTLKDPEKRKEYDRSLGALLKDWDEPSHDPVEEKLSSTGSQLENPEFGLSPGGPKKTNEDMTSQSTQRPSLQELSKSTHYSQQNRDWAPKTTKKPSLLARLLKSIGL